MRTPAEDRERWHTEARERDEARLACGPVDDSESDDPWHPWRGPDPAVGSQVDVEQIQASMEQPWRLSWRADPRARRLADRHYNRQTLGAKQFVPTGSCLVLLTDDADAVWVTSWPKAEYVQHAWAGAFVNSLFRREELCPYRASQLITAATAATRARWPQVPDLGIVTFVNADKVRRKRDPGRCYRRAGWHLVGTTRAGLLAFQLQRAEFPEPLPARSTQPDLFEVLEGPR